MDFQQLTHQNQTDAHHETEAPPDVLAPQVTPPAVTTADPQLPSTSTRPVAVVRVLSPVGVEYLFLTICLFVGAASLTGVLISLVNGKTDFSVMAFPASSLLVTVPVFAWLFLRLKKLELKNPDQRLDPSKRRSTQFTQVVAFIVVLFTLIGFVFNIFMKMGGQAGISISEAARDALCVVVVAGGILAYYWRDEHKA